MKKCGVFVLAMLASFLLVSCGGGGSSCGFDDPSTPTFNLDGTVWSLEGTTPSNNCPDPTTTFSGSGTFTQSGNTLTATSSGISLKGEISGSQIKFAGDLTIGTETITIDCTTATLTSNSVGSTFSFSGTTWESDYGSGTCDGTSSGTFTRTN
ncbi:MAG: hypothetical protein HYS22_01815 [Deltaproteobacteria bacterium]|nr:hypothetical protein [Deltaproteobacteria bacterium]